MSDFKISRGQGKCGITGRDFADGEQYIVALSPDGEVEGAFQRIDICNDAWERQGVAGYIAWWQAEYSTKRKPALLDPDALWQVFHNARSKIRKAPIQDLPAEEKPAEEFSREDLDRFTYVAALGLMRLRKLKLKGTRRTKKREFLIFQTPGRASQREEYEVLNPELDEKGVEQIQDRLADLA